MSEYTPTTEDIRDSFAADSARLGDYASKARLFDRWLAAHDAEVRGEGRTGGYRVLVGPIDSTITFLQEHGIVSLEADELPEHIENQWEYHPMAPEFAYAGPRYRRRKAGPWEPVES